MSNRESSMRPTPLTACVALIAAAALLAGCSSTTSSDPAAPSGPAADLATIDDGPDPSADAVAAYQADLDQLQTTCTGASDTDLADMAANVKQILADEAGQDVRVSTILSGVLTASTGAEGQQSCSDLFTSYALLVKDGATP